MQEETTKKIIIEIWRLGKKIRSINANVLPNTVVWSIKKMFMLLAEEGFVFVDLTNQDLDSGIEVEIVDREYDATLHEDTCIVKDMITPIILKNNKIICRGEVIVVSGEKLCDGVEGGNEQDDKLRY